MRQTVSATSAATRARAVSALSRTCACGTHTGGGPCDHCKGQEHSRAALIPTGGTPLATSLRERMESQFETRFDTVRLHRGAEADRSARRVNADAFTVGSDIVLSSRAQDLSSPAGEQLLAHELTHVAQQQSAPAPSTLAVTPSTSPLEYQAGASAANVVTGEGAGPIHAAPVQSIQRQAAATAGPQPPPANETEALKQLKRALTTIQVQLAMSKDRRDEQEKINNEQWIVAGVSEAVGSFANVFKGQRSLSLPPKALWVPAETLSARASERLASRDVIGSARLVHELAEEYKKVALELNEYIEGVIGGAEFTTTGLQVTAAAGAIAATIATGGAATAAGAGLLGTSVAVAGGAGVYGLAQETATQGGEKIAGTRKLFDFKAIALRGGKDAIMGFVGALAGGALSKYAANYFGRILMQRLKPEQVAIVAERLGVDASKLTPAVFLSKGQGFVIDFFAGIGTTPLMTAVQTVLTVFEGRETPSGEEFAKQVIEEAIKGGIIQLFLGALTHGAAGKSKTSGTKGTRSQTQRGGQEVVPPKEPAPLPVREQPTPRPTESPLPSEPLQSQTPIETPAVQATPTIEPTSTRAVETPVATVEAPLAAQAPVAVETLTAKPLPGKPPAGEDTASVFAALKTELKAVPEGEGPVVGQRITIPEKPLAAPDAPDPTFTLEQRVESAKLEREMLTKRRAETIDSLKDHPELQDVVKNSKETFGDAQTTLVDLLADPHSLLAGAEGNPQVLRQLYDYWKTEQAAGRLKSPTFEAYLKTRMRQWRGGEGELRHAFDIGPQEILVKAPKADATAPGSDMMTYLKDSDRIRYKDNKAYAKSDVESVSALEQNILKNLQDDIALIEDSIKKGPREQENVPPEIAEKVLPRLKDAAKELEEYVRNNINQNRSPRQQKDQFARAKHQRAVEAILRNNRIERVVTTEAGGQNISLGSKLTSEGFTRQ